MTRTPPAHKQTFADLRKQPGRIVDKVHRDQKLSDYVQRVQLMEFHDGAKHYVAADGTVSCGLFD